MRETTRRPGAQAEPEGPQAAGEEEQDAAGGGQEAARQQRAHKRRAAAHDAEAEAFNQRHAAEAAEFNQLTKQACVGEDGKLDVAAVKEWQREHNVAPDGKVGPKTIAAAGGKASDDKDSDKIDGPAKDKQAAAKKPEGPIEDILSWLDLDKAAGMVRQLEKLVAGPPTGGKDAGKDDGATPEGELDHSGLASELAVDQFVAAVERMKPKWERMKPVQRSEALISTVNDQLAGVGIDPVRGVFDESISGQIAGQFQRSRWQIGLNKRLFARQRMTADAAPAMATTVYHEARHAEQHYRMAQVLAGQQGAKAAAIAKKIDIPLRVVESAMKKPLKGDAAAYGQKMFDDKYGKHAAHYDQVYQAVKAQMAIFTDVKTRLQAAKTPEEKEAVQKEYETIKTPVMKAYLDYKALATETDAFHVEDEANAGFASKK